MAPRMGLQSPNPMRTSKSRHKCNTGVLETPEYVKHIKAKDKKPLNTKAPKSSKNSKNYVILCAEEKNYTFHLHSFLVPTEYYFNNMCEQVKKLCVQAFV